MLIAAATLVPAPSEPWLREFWCLRCGSFDPTELVANVLLFVPLGLALRASGVRLAKALAIVVATTVGIETLQFFAIIGRDGSLRDCLTNAAGGALGFAAYPQVGQLWRANGSPSRALAWVAAALWVAHAAMASILLEPTGTTYQYFAQLAPELGKNDTFRGAVLAANMNGVRVESGPLTHDLEARLKSADSIALSGAVIATQTVGRTAPIVNLADNGGSNIAILAQQLRAVAFQAHVRGQAIGFAAPWLVIDNVFGEPAPRTPVLLFGLRRGYELRLRVKDVTSRIREARLTLVPSLGWTLWWPFGVVGRVTRDCLTAVWVFLPVALIGFWSATVAAPLVAALGAEVAVPLVLGPRTLSWPALIISLAGVACGVIAGRLRSAAGKESLGASD